MKSLPPIAEPTLVDTEESATYLNSWLERHKGIVSLDLETTGCNPKEESPIGKARVFCMTAAWLEDGKVESFYCPKDLLPCFRGWIESWAPKVGTNLFGFDRHALANEGYELRGIVADTLLQSRLLNPDKQVKHGLKAWMEKQGWTVTTLKEITSRPKAGKVESYKRDSVKTKGTLWPVIQTSGALFQKIAWGGREQMSLDELWTLYPGRRKALVQYAVQDSQASLLQSLQLMESLAAVAW